MTGNADGLYICVVYVPPVSSPYFSDEIFHDLSTEISSLPKSKIPVILCGDFNARTGNMLDYIPHTCDKHVSDVLNDFTTQINKHRRNSDSEYNSHGKKLIGLCLENNLRIANGRCLGNSFGKCTFFSCQGGKSLIDYSVVSDFFFQHLNCLIIKPLTHLSDHCQSVTVINTLEDLGTSFSSNSTYQWKKGPNLFHWKKDSPEAHKAALHNKKIREKIENFMMSKFPENSDGVNQANNKLREIMFKAAKLSLTTKRHVKKYKTQKPPKNGLLRSVKMQGHLLRSQPMLLTETHQTLHW